MEGKTHAMIGVAVGLAVATGYHLPAENVIALATIGGAAALLPDVDHPQAAVRQRAGFAGDVTLFWLKHRGFTHTLLALALLGAAAAYFVPGAVALTVTAGYASHLIADLMTVRGLPLLKPFSRRVFWLPPGIVTGGWLESVVFVMALGAVVGLIGGYLQ